MDKMTEQMWLNKIAEFKGKRGEHPTPQEVRDVANLWIEELSILKVLTVMRTLGDDDDWQ